eukprot:IDg16029t1
MSRQYDAVVIPGGGLDHETGAPAAWVVARLDAALTLDAHTQLYVVLSRGTPHRAPPRDDGGFAIDEAAASARYLHARGVACERIVQDGWSLDTIGNAYFTRTMVTDPLQLRQLCVVTSEFHVVRTRAIFDWVFGLDAPAIAYNLHYKVAADVGMEPDVRIARGQKEAAGLARLQESTIPTVTSMRLLARFLLFGHGAYNAASCMQVRKAMDNDAKSSY